MATPPVRSVVVAAEPITDVDSTAAEMLDDLRADLAAAGIRLRFAELKGPVKDVLAGYGLLARLGPDALAPTLGVAVKRYLADNDVEWTDWEDRDEPSDGQPSPAASDGRVRQLDDPVCRGHSRQETGS
jgi:STAS domain